METTKCPHCGANMKIYEFNLSKGLVDMLTDFVRCVKKKGINDIHHGKELVHGNSQYTNFPKLRYWGLIAHVKDEEGKIVAGRWLLTRLGGQFLRNEVAIPQSIKMWRNEIYSKSEETTRISNYFDRTYDGEYFQREFDFDIAQGRLL